MTLTQRAESHKVLSVHSATFKTRVFETRVCICIYRDTALTQRTCVYVMIQRPKLILLVLYPQTLVSLDNPAQMSFQDLLSAIKQCRQCGNFSSTVSTSKTRKPDPPRAWAALHRILDSMHLQIGSSFLQSLDSQFKLLDEQECGRLTLMKTGRLLRELFPATSTQDLRQVRAKLVKRRLSCLISDWRCVVAHSG